MNETAAPDIRQLDQQPHVVDVWGIADGFIEPNMAIGQAFFRDIITSYRIDELNELGNTVRTTRQPRQPELPQAELVTLAEREFTILRDLGAVVVPHTWYGYVNSRHEQALCAEVPHYRVHSHLNHEEAARPILEAYEALKAPTQEQSTTKLSDMHEDQFRFVDFGHADEGGPTLMLLDIDPILTVYTQTETGL